MCFSPEIQNKTLLSNLHLKQFRRYVHIGQGSKIAYFLAGPVGPVVRISAIPTSHHAVPTKICQTRHKALFPLLKTFRFDKYIYT